MREPRGVRGCKVLRGGLAVGPCVTPFCCRRFIEFPISPLLLHALGAARRLTSNLMALHALLCIKRPMGMTRTLPSSLSTGCHSPVLPFSSKYSPRLHLATTLPNTPAEPW